MKRVIKDKSTGDIQMIIDVTHHEYTHPKGGTAHDSKIVTLRKSQQDWIRRFKFKYRAFNSGEEFTGELFNGKKFNPIFSMSDLGVTPDNSAYHIPSEFELKARIEMLTNKGMDYIEKLH